MFSVIFPGQGSQSVGMCRNFYNKYDFVKELFTRADEILGYSISKLILEGPKEDLDYTENTQPAIFLVSYSIYQTIRRETKIRLEDAKYFAGHSLGEYTALAASESLDFDSAIKILKVRGKAMQTAVPKGQGGMLAVLGTEIKNINEILEKNKNKYECFIANDNSSNQVVLSGNLRDLDLLIEDLNNNSIKNIKLPVSAPFHCNLMKPATEIMKKTIAEINFNNSKSPIISNVTAKEMINFNQIKELLIKQIESPVKWRESVMYMMENGVKKFIEIGPGKVLSGLIKRIDKNLTITNVNGINDIKNLNIND